MTIQFKINISISCEQFIDLLKRSTLGERRPIDDRECIEGMLANSNLMLSAWDGDELIGLARSLTDFSYACYLSDLAVCKNYQQQGIGKKLIHMTQNQLGSHCKLILIAAPAANAYYEQLGFTHNQRCWTLDKNISITE